jgi:superfamily II DNA or RNA helicase
MVYNSIFFKRYASWVELEAAIETIETAKEKGTAFEQFVFAYFEYFKDMYLISKVYMENSIPNDLRKKIKLEKRDSGVDGVIVKEDGTTVAYQAKFRSGQVAPSYDELTSFWAESEHADERCIVANCYELPQQAYKKKYHFFIFRNELNSLEPIFFDWLYIFATTGSTKPIVTRYNPMPHQDKMISEVLEGFVTEKRGKMLAACGTGKTLAALWIKERLTAKKTLFVAPNLALIKQTLEAWMPQAKTPFTYLCVCSDVTVAESAKNIENDDFQTDASYIGVPVTTDSEKILDFIKFESSKDKVIFSTYQSLDAIVGALEKIDGFTFDISFFDEAHRTAGNKDTQMFVMGMNDAFIPSEKRLFMTATERFVNPRIIGRAHEYNYEVFSMDNYEQYGPTFSALPFRSAIEQGIISDYKIVLCCMKEGELKSIIDNNLILNVGDREVDAQNLFKQVLLAKTMNDIGIHKAISYHRDINSARRFISSSNSTNLDEVISGITDDITMSDVYCDHINGTMSAGARKGIFDEFIAAPYGVISNARCLTEGVDIPVIDAVYFADPKNSIIDIIQAVGRSLRKVKENPDKTSYIIIPIIIADEISNFEDIDPENFSTLHTVVQALRDQDRILADYIDKLNLKLATGERTNGGEDGVPPLIIEATEQLGIDDIAGKILLRVAEVNRDPANISREFIFEPRSRTSGVERGDFITVGDYNLDSYWKSCVIATLRKYDSFDVGLPRTALIIDHNNVSHAVKIGAIIEKERKFYVTEVGRMLFECSSFQEAGPIFQEQLLKFYKLAAVTRIPHFPYRFALKVLAKVSIISKFEFAYSMFIAKNLGDRGVSKACEIITYLRATYPRIETLNAANKEIVLAALNEKFDTTLKSIDIWSSRTTLHNQFNYLKKHLTIWPGVTEVGKPEITLTTGGAKKIEELLKKTNEIETCPMDKLITNFIDSKNWL